ncbi:hypothetical protein Bbelb_079110 [Branchiostoma belcheri]|nr:hypothetical protein Bbelb_079110 [Branchiostoma belcheri]
MRRPSARVFTLVISTRQNGRSSRLERTGRYDVITSNRCRWRQPSHLMRLVGAPGRQMRRPSARVFTLVISTRQNGRSSRLERTGRYDVITSNRCRWRQPSHLMRLVGAPGRKMRRPSARVFTLVISTRQNGRSSRLERTGRYDVITSNRCRWRQPSHLMRLVGAPGRQRKSFHSVISTRQNGRSSRLERTGRYDVITSNRCRWRQPSHLMRLVGAPGRQMRRPSARVFTLVISTRQNGRSSRLERTGRYDVITSNRCRWRQPSHLMRLVGAPGRQMRRPSARVFTLVISTRQNGRSSRLERTGRYDVITSNRCRWRQPSHLMRLVGAPGRQMRRPSARVFTLVISTRQNGRSSRLERTGRYDVITSNRCRWRQPSHLMRLVGAPGRQMRRPSARVFTLVISTRQNGRSSRLERTGRYDVITSNSEKNSSPLLQVQMSPAVPPDALGRRTWATGMRRPSARVFTLVISTRQNGRSSRLERTGRYDVITSNRCRWRQPSHLMRLVGAPGRQMRRPSARVFTLVISTRQNGRSSRLERTGRYDVITSNRCRWRQPSHLMRLVGAPGRQMRRPSARVFTLVISTRQNGRSSRLERTGRYDVITSNRCRWRQPSH